MKPIRVKVPGTLTVHCQTLLSHQTLARVIYTKRIILQKLEARPTKRIQSKCYFLYRKVAT